MKIKNLLVAIAMIFASAVFAATPVFAEDPDGGGDPAGGGGGGGGSVTCPPNSIRDSANTLAECNVEEDTSLMSTVNTIINVIVSVLGIVAVAVIVLGGVMYVTSTGDPGKTKKAKDTIMYGVIGLVVAILAFAIVNFVLTSIFS